MAGSRAPQPLNEAVAKERRRLIRRARKEAEQSLMLRLCKDAGLPAPEFEFRYIEGRAFAFDYAWPAPFKIALEQEGGFYGVGKPCRECGRRSVAGHTSIERLKTDQWKYNAAALLGWIVFRFQPAEVRAAKFLPWVRQAIEARKAWAR